MSQTKISISDVKQSGFVEKCVKNPWKNMETCETRETHESTWKHVKTCENARKREGFLVFFEMSHCDAIINIYALGFRIQWEPESKSEWMREKEVMSKEEHLSQNKEMKAVIKNKREEVLEQEGDAMLQFVYDNP